MKLTSRCRGIWLRRGVGVIETAGSSLGGEDSSLNISEVAGGWWGTEGDWRLSKSG
jgi:hypothetical protein